MASFIGDNPVNPAVRCVTSSKLPMCEDADLPICEVYGLVDNVNTFTVTQLTFLRMGFSTIQQVDNCNWDVATNEFVILKAGNYTISYDLTIEDGSDSDTTNAFIGINAPSTGAAGNPAVPVRYAGQRTMEVNNGAFANVSSSTTIPLQVGDRVGAYMAEDVNVADIPMLSQGRLSIHSLIGNFQ